MIYDLIILLIVILIILLTSSFNRDKSNKKERVNRSDYTITSSKNPPILKQNNPDAKFINEIESKSDYEYRKYLEQRGVTCFYHMTHKSNLKSIFDYGILSHHSIHLRKIDINNISNISVNNRRERIEPIFNKKVHEYVPLYFNCKNPMLFAKKAIQDDITFLMIDIAVIWSELSLYTNGNAASENTIFYNSPCHLSNLNWECIMGQYWGDYPDGKRIRCAEVLIFPEIPLKYIKSIFCKNKDTLFFINKVRNRPKYIPIIVNKKFYF